MRVARVLATVTVVTLGAACGADAGPNAGQGAAYADAEVVLAPGSAPEAAEPVAASEELAASEQVAAAEQVAASEPSRRRQELEQPAIWPASDVVFATPEEAAADFVRSVLISGGEPALGDFQSGDSRSGEIVVFSPDESGGPERFERGLLSLRQLGPSDGWFVIAATSDGAMITSPTPLAEVPAGPITVAGEARGFEGTVLISAFPAGDLAGRLDQVIGRGGPFADLEPFSEELDLSGATPGQVIVLLAHGDTGLGTDPSSFAAFPVVVAETAPVTIPPTR